MKINIARWFSYTLGLESQLKAERLKHAADLEHSDRVHNLQIELLHASNQERLEDQETRHTHELDLLCKEAERERASLNQRIEEIETERRWLQDRLLQSQAGVPPIYDASPGQTAQEKIFEQGTKRTMGPRELARADSAAARSEAFSRVEKEVAAFRNLTPQDQRAVMRGEKVDLSLNGGTNAN